jgi:hypothetical protein
MMGPAANPTAAQKPTHTAAATAAKRQPLLQLLHATAPNTYAATTHHILQQQDI